MWLCPAAIHIIIITLILSIYIHIYIYIYERVREETKYKSEMNTATDSLVTPLLTDAYQLTMAYVSHKHNNNEKERVSEKVSR